MMWFEMQSFREIGLPSSMIHRILSCLQLCNMVDVEYTVVQLVLILENKNQNYQEFDGILTLITSCQNTT